MQTMQTDNFVTAWMAALVMTGKSKIDMVQEMPLGMARVVSYISSVTMDKSITCCQTSFELMRLSGVLAPSSEMGLAGGLRDYVNGSKFVAVTDKWNCGVLDILMTRQAAAEHLAQIPQEWRGIVENCARAFRGQPLVQLGGPRKCAFMPTREQPGLQR